MILPREASKSFPEIVETKENLLGVKKTFTCQKLSAAPGHVVVLYIAPKDIQVAHLTLPAGTVTFGHFWADRPYNVYHWLSPAGATLGLYFNIASDTAIGEYELSWRDLVLDVLVLPGQEPVVLDREELPSDLSPSLSAHIEDAVQMLLVALPGLNSWLEVEATMLWPQVFYQVRAQETAP